MALQDIAAWNDKNQFTAASSSCSSCGSSSSSDSQDNQEGQASGCTATPLQILEDPSSCAASCTAESSQEL